jgi:hypothetical protein
MPGAYVTRTSVWLWYMLGAYTTLRPYIMHPGMMYYSNLAVLRMLIGF